MKFLTILLIIICICNKANASPYIKTNYNKDRQLIELSVLKGSSRKCALEIRSSEKKLSLVNNRFGGFRIFTSSISERKKSIRLKYSPNSENIKNKKIYLSSVIECNGRSYVSAPSELSLPVEVSITEPLEILLRKNSLKQYTLVEEALGDNTFIQPVDIQSTTNGDKKLFIVEQKGKIFSVTKSLKTEFLDLTDRVLTGSERGLLGLALSPDFSSSGLFYVNYTRKDDGATIIARFKSNSNGTADLASEEILLTIAQPFANHNGGGLAFGPDGFLYIALGDGGSRGDPFGNGQSLKTLLGKILRIDVSKKTGYRIPKDNPFINSKDGALPEIFAYGVRNPWRISFDGKNLWAGDVGQNSKEEINLIKTGGNYGWNIKEGKDCYSVTPCDSAKYINPIHEYGRDLGVSVTGGYVSRELDSPNLNGVYFFADFVSGRIFALEKQKGRYIVTEIQDSDLLISSFGRGSNKENYIASYVTGKIYRLKQSF